MVIARGEMAGNMVGDGVDGVEEDDDSGDASALADSRASRACRV